MEYRIQKRRFSSNIIEVGEKNESGKMTWTPFLGCFINKKKADPIVDRVLKMLQDEQI